VNDAGLSWCLTSRFVLAADAGEVVWIGAVKRMPGVAGGPRQIAKMSAQAFSLTAAAFS
jgi:hypothetical protein